MSGGADQPPPRRNPFSPMAVAKITGFQDSDAVELTIETDAIRQATSYLSAYLREGPGRAGEVIAILGDYGTGKTHLAIELVRHAGRVLNDPGRAMYLDATADGFVELYRRFMAKLGLAGVRGRVNDYYADVVAAALQNSGMDSDVVEWMRERDLVPRDVVEKLGLMESALLRQVQRTLQRVTDNTDFGAALTLLLRSGFDDVVWAWLSGGKPDQLLVERGITRPIDNDVAALEAMGVFALLYGGRQARFVLVIDELDKIFSAANKPEADTVTAFQKLLEVCAGAGACLVLCGLPEFRRVLHPSAAQRVSRAVEMGGLSTGEVCAFIKLAHGARLGVDDLAPFTRDTVRYLRDLAVGNARNVIRLCHDVYGIVDDARRDSGDPDLMVTDEMVRRAARRQFGSLSTDDIDELVRRVLDANGWNYLRDHVLGDAVADFWVTFRDRAGGCAVLLTESILDEADVNAVAHRSLAVRDAAPDAKVVLVVAGVVAELLAPGLAEPLDAEPLVYSAPGFAEGLKALVGAVSDQLRRVGDGSPQTAMLQRIEQLGRQESSIYGLVEQLAERQREEHGATERRFAELRRELTALTRSVRGVSGPAGGLAPSELPAEVDVLFRDVLERLDELTDLDAVMGDAFDDPGAIPTIQRRLHTPDLPEAVGAALLVRAAVLAFRTSVLDWYATEPAGPSPAAVARLDLLCQAYDDVTEFVPTFKLERLARLGPWTAGDAPSLGRTGRYERLRSALDGLSPGVRRAVSGSRSASEG